MNVQNIKKINLYRSIMVATIAAIVILCMFFSFDTVHAAIPQCSSGSTNNICATSDKSLIGDLMKNVINLMLYLAGAIAVIMIVVGGIRYVTSDGDPGRTSKAKDTVMYALVGLVVASMAYALVNFIIAKV